MADETDFPPCFDPYLQYMLDQPAVLRAFVDPKDDKEREDPYVSLLIRLKDGVSALQFRESLLARAHGAEVHVGPTQDPVPYVTARVPAAMMTDSTWFPYWAGNASDISLSIPIDVACQPVSSGLAFDSDRPKSQAKTIIGILDDGCAFAHHRLRRWPEFKSRVFAIWDQERARRRIVLDQAPLRVFGRRPVDFRYGLEFWRDGGTGNGVLEPQAEEVGIDKWISMHLTPFHTVDEDGCYAHGEFTSLRRRETHGSHITDVLAGWVPTSARVSTDRKTPPSFEPDPASTWEETDIVFVQIPRRGVEDASGQWLRCQVIDGLRYILSCAGSDTTRVVFNLSYGRTTGPHDGSSAIEEFLSLMVQAFNGHLLKPSLEVVLPAGNSRRSACHLTFKSTQPGTTRWTWRVPADNTVEVMAEVRVRNGHAAHVTNFRLDPPAPYAGQQAQVRRRQGLHDTRWVLIIPPTRGDAKPLQTTPAGQGPALHGDWNISLTLSQPNVDVHAYVARTDPNMGARPGAKQSRFIDPAWELTASAAAASQTPEGAAAATGSLVTASGTLSGIATACANRVYVAAGYCIASERFSPYSSAGPSRGARVGPDYALPTDESRALAGIPGAGTRSGCVFRLVGTSTASPQLARLVANPLTRPNPCPEGGPPPNADVGCGMLPPP